MRRFVLLHKQLDADDDEITRTRKVRRAGHQRALRATSSPRSYGGAPRRWTIKTTVTYQDGSKAERDDHARRSSRMDGVVAAKQAGERGAAGLERTSDEHASSS